jgi:hypothetical protein
MCREFIIIMIIMINSDVFKNLLIIVNSKVELVLIDPYIPQLP